MVDCGTHELGLDEARLFGLQDLGCLHSEWSLQG